MAIPELANGMLPTGIHPCSFEEVTRHFGTTNPSPRRGALWNSATQYITEAAATGLFKAVYIDGSFTTDKEDPGDVDLVLATDLTRNELITELFSQGSKLLFGTYMQRFGLEAYPLCTDTPRGTLYDLRDYFQRVKTHEAQRRGVPKSYRKGILKVAL